MLRPLLRAAPEHQLIFGGEIEAQAKARLILYNIGFKTGIFNKEEIINIFTLFDLKREGFIDRQRCK